MRNPTEASEQSALFDWAARMSGRHPELRLMYHIANGGRPHPAEAARLKAQGVKPGVPDICLPVARGGYAGLYIELKRPEGGRTSSDQKRWIKDLAEQGYSALVCEGWRAAAEAVAEYLS